jgi:thiol-disulfide isomerase/thioredoxin
VRLILLAVFAGVCFPQVVIAQVVPTVEKLVVRGDLANAQALTSLYRRQYGNTPEALAAMSWLARGELNAQQYDKALADAEEVQRLVTDSLALRKLDGDPYTPLALGASYEVQAQSMAALKRRSEALQLLQSAERQWRGTSIVPRLQKNVLLLTLVGHPLPEIHGTPNVWRGKPVLFFFWAHWCPDCKAMAPAIAKLAAEFEPKGLIVVAPTRLYGYTAEHENATPAEEKTFIDKVYQRFYAVIPKAIVPLDTSNFERFGASTTPTLVLADKNGTVRLYHPGSMKEQALRDAIVALGFDGR